MKLRGRETPADSGQRSSPTRLGAAPDTRRFIEEVTRLAIESVENGWGGPFGAVIVKDGAVVGRGQNRVLLTGCPVYHAEVTAIMDACRRLNPKALIGSGGGAGTILESIPREPGSSDPVPERARMLRGCEIYINAAPCPMCMSAIYWARLDRVVFAASLDDARQIGFDDAFQYEDFARPWSERRSPSRPASSATSASRRSRPGRERRIDIPTRTCTQLARQNRPSGRTDSL